MRNQGGWYALGEGRIGLSTGRDCSSGGVGRGQEGLKIVSGWVGKVQLQGQGLWLSFPSLWAVLKKCTEVQLDWSTCT